MVVLLLVGRELSASSPSNDQLQVFLLLLLVVRIQLAGEDWASGRRMEVRGPRRQACAVQDRREWWRRRQGGVERGGRGIG